ncbi:hypothetical protein JCM19237_6090 [Photobacterium aphoticum]|uniref:Uncharacterized protein n=1 Tax=Photobacterium aphoticum TaxID=754436 RepID=A0A090R6C3_9GAMM|nr:hypothetical protein JCM19237_6090 [Photobacterium aphoticum]
MALPCCWWGIFALNGVLRLQDIVTEGWLASVIVMAESEIKEKMCGTKSETLQIRRNLQGQVTG